MKKWSLAVAGFLAIALFALYWFFLSPEKTPQHLTLWYVSSEFSADSVEQLASKYNLQITGEDYLVTLVAFDSEEALAAAYGEDSYPDLLLCSYSRAADLGEREQLNQLEGLSFDYLPEIKQALPYAGSSFFPLGSSVPILTYSDATPAPSSDLGEFYLQGQQYYLATSQPFFTAEAALPALSTWSAAMGYELKGDLALDDLDETFCTVYNSMAEQVMLGSFMPPASGALNLVGDGLIPCAIVASCHATSLPEGVSIAPLPMPDGGDSVYVPELWGIAVTSVNSYAMDSCRAFALWLMSGYTPDDALDLGLVPVTSGATAQTDTALDSLLMDVYTSSPIVYSPLGEYMKNYAEMETQVCHALDLIY